MQKRLAARGTGWNNSHQVNKLNKLAQTMGHGVCEVQNYMPLEIFDSIMKFAGINITIIVIDTVDFLWMCENERKA